LFTAFGTEEPAPVPTEQPEIDLATVSDAAFNAPLQPGRQVANIDGPPVVRGLPDEPGFFAGTREAIADAESRLADVLASEEEFGGATGNRAAGEEARLGVGAGVDIGTAAVTGVAKDLAAGAGRLVQGPLDFLGGLTGLGGPASANAQEETDVTGQTDAVSGEQGEVNTADAADKLAEDAATKDTAEVTEAIESETTRSNQPGVQGSVGGGVVNRLLGPPLQPRDQRGPGVEVIRGLRRTFQPTGPEAEAGATITVGGEEFPAGARAEGGEIPFGRGTLERFENAGFTTEQAGEMALAAEETEARLINAGAQALIAQTNATSEIQIPLNDGSGRSVRGYAIIGGDAKDGIRFIRTNMLSPLADDMFVSQTEIDTTDATGRTTKLKKPLFFLESNVDGISSLHEVPVGSKLSSRITGAFEKNPDEFEIALDQAKTDGFNGPARFNKALELLDDLVTKGK
jgi:hypothetical protein